MAWRLGGAGTAPAGLQASSGQPRGVALVEVGVGPGLLERYGIDALAGTSDRHCRRLFSGACIKWQATPYPEQGHIELDFWPRIDRNRRFVAARGQQWHEQQCGRTANGTIQRSIQPSTAAAPTRISPMTATATSAANNCPRAPSLRPRGGSCSTSSSTSQRSNGVCDSGLMRASRSSTGSPSLCTAGAPSARHDGPAAFPPPALPGFIGTIRRSDFHGSVCLPRLFGSYRHTPSRKKTVDLPGYRHDISSSANQPPTPGAPAPLASSRGTGCCLR